MIVGFSLVIKVGRHKREYNLSPSEVDFLGVLSKIGCKTEIDTIFSLDDIAKKKNLRKRIFVKSAQMLLEFIQKQRNVLPCIYSLKIETPPGSGLFAVGSGIASGIIINGEEFMIEGGLGECQLFKIKKNKKGDIQRHSIKDITKEKSIETDNRGKILIIKKKNSKLITYLRRVIRDCIESKCEGIEIVIT
jgi:hypothetical protein